ncbi:MAG: High-affinity nickel transporter [Planctomycetes bacterium]|nr:High-affinity nickel transporter [Planctomycetota bacterium]
MNSPMILADLAHDIRVDTAWLAVGTGLLAGIAHTFMGADHLAALMPLSVNRKLRAAIQGVRWGVGHSMGVIVVTLLLLVGREKLNLEFFSEWGERMVGAMLILFGMWGLRQAARQNLHLHDHAHDDQSHAHWHVHGTQAHDPAESGMQKHVHTHAAFAAGTLHGLAGMAHLLGVLPALMAPTIFVSCTYLAGFATGSIVSMAVFAGGFGVITARLGAKSPMLLKASMYVSAVLCLLIGLAWIFLPMAGIELP